MRLALGPVTTLLSAQTLTSAYVQSTITLDLQNFDSARVEVSVANAQALTANIIFLWSETAESGTWFPEIVNAHGTPASGELPITSNAARYDVDMTATGNKVKEAFQRRGRFLTVKAKSSTTTTGTITVTACGANIYR